ncbi:Uncharacterised protein [Streptococcus pneumoniae]|nr:Uncharacterised protein [Streptococcus pneumoniae]CIW05045.1 Uncharacterised protein [Streptococcus pneumoniae]
MITFVFYHLRNFFGYQSDFIRLIKDINLFRRVIYQRTTQSGWIVSKTKVKTDT